MHCLEDYKKEQFPKKNEEIIRQLSDEASIKYGVQRTNQLLSTSCDARDLIVDVECRRYHLNNLLTLTRRFFGDESSQSVVANAQNIANQLSDITQQIQKHGNDILEMSKIAYQGIISPSNMPKDLGTTYIHLCEDLQLEIFNAEQRSSFPRTTTLMANWLREQGPASQFEPKILPLIQALEEDLGEQRVNPRTAPRIKIGVIGYTNAGKSTLINRLLGVASLPDDRAAPVSDSKSTYFPLRFDREDPLIDGANGGRKTLVTLVDIQGLDENRTSTHRETAAGDYLDEARNADCDIYIIVFDKQLSEEQRQWIREIEETLCRQCVLVRSKIDTDYLRIFQQYSGKYYMRCPEAERPGLMPQIMSRLRNDNAVESRSVHLVACDYSPPNSDAAQLIEDHSFFDVPGLLDELSALAAQKHFSRMQQSANQISVRVINTCFRRSYILNVAKYKVAAGFASIIPFGDQLPRYLAREGIREAFGISEELHRNISYRNLRVYGYKLQTSVFKDSVTITDSPKKNLEFDGTQFARAGATGLIIAANFGDDVVRLVAPAAMAGSTAARVAFTAATLGVGLVLSAGLSAWSAIDSGKHIFSYVNRLCDDIIMVNGSLIASTLNVRKT